MMDPRAVLAGMCWATSGLIAMLVVPLLLFYGLGDVPCASEMCAGPNDLLAWLALAVMALAGAVGAVAWRVYPEIFHRR